MSALLSLKGIGKSFLGTVALQDIDFDVRGGEIHALLGENGAGKSTLIKVLTGVYPADAGGIALSGHPIRPTSPAEAVGMGISPVYQEVNLLPNLSVMENVVLGREPRTAFGIAWGEMRRRAQTAIDRVGLRLDVRRPLGSLSIAEQQLVAIARGLDVSARVLILDEPTSSLDNDEVEALFRVMRRLRDDGVGIVFVTHFLDQVYAVSDRITVLRNGQKVGTWDAVELPRLELISKMIGRDASTLERERASAAILATDAPFLRARGLGKARRVNGLTFDLAPGEVMGMAGLLGSGRTESARLLFGLDRFDTGQLNLDGARVTGLNPRRAIRSGFGFLSEDRKHEGIFPELTVRENMLILSQVKNGWWRRPSLAAQRVAALEMVKTLDIRPPDIERQITFLSGGNQQKALIARWLAVKPRMLILDEPTRGIDIGAKFEIMSLMESMRKAGGAFVFISSELPEVVRASTKALVLRDRDVRATLTGDEITEGRIVEAIANA